MNGFLVILFLAKNKINNITTCNVFSLAISDLMFTLFCIPFTAYVYLVNDWYLGETVCKTTHFLSCASVYAYSFTLAFMIHNRCYYIINKRVLNRNTLFKHRTKKFSLISILIWLGKQFIFCFLICCFSVLRYLNQNLSHIFFNLGLSS